MSIHVTCPNCKNILKVNENLAGKRVKCLVCQKPVLVSTAVPEELVLMPHSAPTVPVVDELALVAPGLEQADAVDREVKRCTACGKDVPSADILCVGCGYNFKTSRREKGFEIAKVGRGKWYIGTVFSSLFFFALVVGGGYAMYWSFTKGGITDRFKEMGQPGKTEEARPRAPVSTQREEKTPAPKVEPKPTTSLLVVSTNQFAKVAVYLNGNKLGEAHKGQTAKFPLPAQPAKISFSVSTTDLPAGVFLSQRAKDSMQQGFSFNGTTSEGVRVFFKSVKDDKPYETAPVKLILKDGKAEIL